MLTAAEALELVKRSDAEVEKFLTVISPAIEAAAKDGKRTLALSSIVNLPDHGAVSLHQECSKIVNITDFQQRLCATLKEFGYSVKFAPHGDTYVPRGLADDDGYGPLYQHYTIIVYW